MQFSDLLDGYSYPWLTIALFGTLAVVIALLVHAVLFAVLRRITRFSTVASTLVEFTARPARLVLALLGLQFVLAGAPEDLRLGGVASHGVSLLLIGAITWLAMRAVAGVGEALIRLHPANVGDNLQARRVQTQTRVISRTVMFFLLVIGIASGLMTFPGLRQVGTSILASAGVAGLVAGIAARSVFGNLIAGLQIALSQPIRLDDVVIIQGEWGRIEEITSTYVVVKIWDERRLVVPLQWIIENPFQNWTRTGSQLLGTVFLWVDYRVPLAPLRAELERICKASPEWDGRVASIVVTETTERSIQIRALMSSPDSSTSWDLRCRVREGLINFLQCNYPEALPRMRAEIERKHEEAPPEPVPDMPPIKHGIGDSQAIREPTHPEEVQHAADPRAPADPADAPVAQGR